MIAQAALEEYCSKSGDDDIAEGTLEENEHGFCVWGVADDHFVLVQVYGDGEYWQQWAETTAKANGYNKILIATKRSPAAFMRKYGYKVAGYVLEKEL